MKYSLVIVVLAALYPCARPVTAEESVVHFEEGIGYSTVAGRTLELDLASPGAGEGPFPVVLCIHGGGWQRGKRQAYGGMIRQFAENGFAALTVSYRFAPDDPWPAQIEDVRAALKWIHEHAAERRLDKRRIGVIGASAGGHLSLMLGLEAEQNAGEYPPVEAIVNYFGPSDMRRQGSFTERVEKLIVDLAGGASRQANPAAYEAFSPVGLVSTGDPAVLTFHGAADGIVPVEQARILHRALGVVGVSNRLEILPSHGHGWNPELTWPSTLAYFESYLKGSGLPLVLVEDFDSGAERWEPTDATAWEVKTVGEQKVYSLNKKKSDYEPQVRSPYNISLFSGAVVTDFVLDATVRSTHPDYGHRDLCLFFGHQDPEHFYYVHLGKKADAHANSIFLVNGAPRVSISTSRTDGTNWDDNWHRVRVRREIETGLIEIFFDDLENPVMTANDATFGWGRIGVGSFDDTGDFDTIRLRGTLKEISGNGFEPRDFSTQAGFVSMFDGVTLTGWRSVPVEKTKDWSVRDGAIVGSGSEDRLVYLVWREEDLADFELAFSYRMVTDGNSGVEIRGRADSSGKRPFEGYHADFGHIGIGKRVLGAWDFHFAQRKEHDCRRGTSLVIDSEGNGHRSKVAEALSVEDLSRGGWNHAYVIARRNHCQFFINGKLASEFTDNHRDRLTSGVIGLQIHNAGMKVAFKDLWIKRL